MMTLEEMYDLAATLRRIANLPIYEAAVILGQLRVDLNNKIIATQKAENAL